MIKEEVYRLRDILRGMKYIKQADTDKTATHDRFCKVYDEGIEICNKNIDKMRPLSIKQCTMKEQKNYKTGVWKRSDNGNK